MHLAIDAYGVDRDVLADEEVVAGFLAKCPDTIGMTPITEPQVYTYRGRKPGDWGISGFVLIAESHISVHTFPERGYLNVDVFSCKDFDQQKAEDEVAEHFGTTETRVWLMERGIDHDNPRSMYGEMVRDRSRLAGRGAGQSR